MRFKDFGCERRMSRDQIGVASWCSGRARGPASAYPSRNQRFELALKKVLCHPPAMTENSNVSDVQLVFCLWRGGL